MKPLRVVAHAVLRLLVAAVLAFTAAHLLAQVGWGQTLQMTVSRSALPNAKLCDVVVEIRRGATTVGTLTRGALAPGQSAALSITSGQLGLAFGDTAMLTQLWTAQPIVIDNCLTDTKAGCKVSVQIIDNVTNWTTLLMQQ